MPLDNPAFPRTGDQVTFRGSKDVRRLSGASPDGIVQVTLEGGGIMTTDMSEIATNYTANSRVRAEANGIPYAEQRAIDLAPPEFREAFEKAVDDEDSPFAQTYDRSAKFTPGYSADHTDKF